MSSILGLWSVLFHVPDPVEWAAAAPPFGAEQPSPPSFFVSNVASRMAKNPNKPSKGERRA